MSSTLLELSSLNASYGPVKVLHGVELKIKEGQISILLGANGAGKTSTLRAISGSVNATGSVKFNGSELLGLPTSKIARLGIAHVPQGRGTFPELTVLDNLMAGAINRRDKKVSSEVEEWFQRFPVLGERRNQLAGLLSGGEQQMLAIARAMMSKPELLMLDEPSLGLAPKIVKEIFTLFSDLNKQLGISMLIVEQNAEIALSIADYGSVLEAGKTVLEGTAESLHNNPIVQKAYLGGENNS